MSRKTRRKSGVKRHPNGRIVATGPTVERDTKTVAEEARMRHHGLTKADAGKQEAGTAIGRLLHNREISPAQHEALVRVREVFLAFNRAIGSPAPLGSAGDLERGPSHDNRDGTDEAYVEECRVARRNMGLARRELLRAGARSGNANIMIALDSWVLADRENWSTLPELLLAANTLIRLFRVHEQRAA